MKFSRQKTDFSVMYSLKIGRRDFLLGMINMKTVADDSDLFGTENVNDRLQRDVEEPVRRNPAVAAREAIMPTPRDRFCNTGCGTNKCRKARHA